MYRFQVVVEVSYLHEDNDAEQIIPEIANALATVVDELKYRDGGLKDQVVAVGEYINYEILPTDKEID